MKCYPFYVIFKDNEWIAIASPLNKDIKHTTLWELIVARMVAIGHNVKYSDIKNLPYSQIRGRIVGKTLYYGNEFSAEQKKAIIASLGNFVFVYDEHEKMSEYDVEVFNNLKNKA
jgi:hypothetical protein